MRRLIRRFWWWAGAFFRWNLDAVCDLSVGRGAVDYHDYHDTAEGYPDHFTELTCERCGKGFWI